MGSLAIADELRSRNSQIKFILDDDKEAINTVRSRGYEATIVQHGHETNSWVENKCDVAIVNKLTSPLEQLSLIRQRCAKLVTIDDTGDGSRKLADLRINPFGAYYNLTLIMEKLIKAG